MAGPGRDLVLPGAVALRRPERRRLGHRLRPHLRPARVPIDPFREVVVMSSTEELIGRADVNDVEAILAITNSDVDEVTHAVADNADAIFTWDYTLARPALRKLYEKAKVGQWNASTDLPWDTEVDLEAVIKADEAAIGTGMDPTMYIGTPVEKWGEKERVEFGMEGRRWRLSQFMHGEQGALLCTAKIVEPVPRYDAQVYARYSDEKLGGRYQINAHLRMLLDDIVNDSRWDMTYLGMQVMVEGLALAAFGFLHQLTGEPLLKQLLRYVMSDEARHVAFGVLSLKEVYDGMSDAEIKDRQEFAFEAAIRMRDRFMQQEVWERMGIDMRDVMPVLLEDPTRGLFQSMLFSKIVPNCKKLGLLERNDKWLRRRFEEMGVIQFEDWQDTGEEYSAFELGQEAPAPVGS